MKFLVPPRWILEPTDKAFAQGSDAAVECKADGFPKPVVTWKRATGKDNFFFIKEMSTKSLLTFQVYHQAITRISNQTILILKLKMAL